MRLRDSKDEHAFRMRLRDWLGATLAPVDDTWRPGAVSSVEELRAWGKALFEAGYTGLTWPSAHGGRGLPATYQAIYAEESTLAGAPEHGNIIGLNMVGPTVIAFGTPEQQAETLPGILAGDIIFCQGFSEPGAGSDLAAVRTRAEPTADGYRLNGEKVWSSYAHLADRCLLLARTEAGSTRHAGLTCFLLDMATPGVTVRPLRQLSGDTDFNQIVLTDVAVPASAVLGTPGAGWQVAMTTLAHERGTFGITLTARLTREFDRMVRTARAYGANTDPAVRRAVAELYVRLQALRFTGYRALATLVRTGRPGPETSILKLEWSRVNQEVAALALRVMGTAALLDGPDAHRGGYWQHQRLRSRANSVEGGTSEILRGIIAERVLGLPRSR
jgi:alkylation response protein AidB-like acyl-CoA dehydrogenase